MSAHARHPGRADLRPTTSGFRLGALVAVCLLGWRAPARANGRFPEANQLAVDPLDPAHLVVRTTFGILRSTDAGATWTWICETAVSPTGLLDEQILITAGGRTSIALSNGINVGERSFCDWQRAQGDVEGQQVTDLVRDARAPGTAYAAVAVTIDGFLAGRIARTTDGTSWAFVGDVLPGTIPLTIEISASRPARLYLGSDDDSFAFGHIDVSDDAGATWTRHDAPGDPQSVYLSAVDPVNPDRVYVRSKSPGASALYVSENGAETWTSILSSADAPLTGFALSPDGSQVAVGSDSGLVVLRRSEAADGTSTFSVARTKDIATKCLTWTAAGLYVCASEASDGFTIGLSTDEGQTFRPLLQTAHLAPLTACPEGSVVSTTCPREWCPLAMTIGASCSATAAPSDSGVDASSGTGATPAHAGSGCGCQVPPSSRSPTWMVAAAFAALALTQRRHSRRTRRTPP